MHRKNYMYLKKVNEVSVMKMKYLGGGDHTMFCSYADFSILPPVLTYPTDFLWGSAQVILQAI